MKYLITVFVTALVIFFGTVTYLNKRFVQVQNKYDIRTLNTVAVAVKNNYTRMESRVSQCSNIVASSLSSDLNFVMKLTVEKNLSALEILEATNSFYPLSGLSFLELTDSSFRILSSAHEPSRVGNIDLDMQKLSDNTPKIIDIMTKDGTKKLLAYKKPFKCAETQLYCISGLIIDSATIGSLATDPETSVLFRNGSSIIGGDVESISNVKNSTIVINDSLYLAVNIPLYSDSSSLVILRSKTTSGGIIDIF